MRVLFVTSNSMIGNSRVAKEARALIEAGYEVMALGWDREQNHKLQEDEDLQVGEFNIPRWTVGISSAYGTGMKNLGPLVQYERELSRALRVLKDKYDIIHACDFDSGFICERVGHRLSKVVVYDIFDYFADSRKMPSHLTKLVSKLEDLVVTRADATIICTEQRKVQIAHAKPKHLQVIENSPPDVYEQLLGRIAEPDDKTTSNESDNFDEQLTSIAYIGTLDSNRYIDRLLKAVKCCDELCLRVAGSGFIDEEVKRASQACDRINYYGPVSYEEALRLESLSDVMVALYDPIIANHRLAAPNKFYEAIMLGKPLIAVKGTSVGDWVMKLGIGQALSPDFSSEELAQAVLEAARANRDGSITAKGRRDYEQNHRWSIMEQRLVELYERVGGQV